MNTETTEKIKTMQEGGHLLRNILDTLLSRVKAGVETSALDKLANDLITEAGGSPSFKTVRNYKWATCMCVNDEVVHGIPDDKLQLGDLLCIDIGLLYKGYHTDTAKTVIVENNQKPVYKNPRLIKFLKTGQEALNKGISKAKINNRIGDISKIIQETVEGQDYSVVRSLVGHGVGKRLHEEPQIPGFLDVPIEATSIIKEGMTLAIEVIYNEGLPEVVYKNNDGWTIITKDGSLSAVFEHTIAITKSGQLLLT